MHRLRARCLPPFLALSPAPQYLETYLEKTGPEWVREDSALYYALSLDQFALPAARVLLRYPSALVFLSRASLLLVRLPLAPKLAAFLLPCSRAVP